MPPTPGRFQMLDADKLRGGYYTPAALAEWACSWAIRASTDRVLEPSCGDGAFLGAAAARLLALGALPTDVAVQGVELLATEAQTAREALLALGVTGGQVHEGDFFSWSLSAQPGRFDVAVGNPPFIRYQSLPEPYRSGAMAVLSRLGLKPNRMTNSWVPFVVAAVADLKPGGRLAMVLPAELLQVGYAGQLRAFLAAHFVQMDIVACTELFFENVQQEVVLLLADGKREAKSEVHPCQVAMHEVDTAVALLQRTPAQLLADRQPKVVHHDTEKWLKYFLTEREMALMRALRQAEVVSPMAVHASVDVGVVTGRNAFFVLNAAQVREAGLQAYATPIVSRASQLQGARLSRDDWRRLSEEDGQRVHLLQVAPDHEMDEGSALAAYIEQGEQQALHRGHKCAIRAVWYAVPYVWQPDAFMFRQVYGFPHLVENAAQATATDTIHRVRSLSAPTAQLIPNFYTYLTGASAEIEGRSYGGGVLELEPTEAERLLMPATLQQAMPLEEIDTLLRQGRLTDVLEQNSRLVLRQGLGLGADDCDMLKQIWLRMRDRRLVRRKRKRSSLSGVDDTA